MKQTLTLPYGHEKISFSMATEGYMGTFLPTRVESDRSQEDIMQDALNNPVGQGPLGDKVKPTDQVIVVTSDMTRPCPNDVVLPPLLAKLNQAGVVDENITVVIGLGLHRKMTEAELRQSVGEEVFSRVDVINHDIDDVVAIGETSRGTKVEIFRPVVEADFRVCVGNVEFHYFAGFSGGAKAILPGVASRATVNSNHSHMIKDPAVAAALEGNPVREDIEEGVALLGADYLFNVIVDEHHKVIDAASGDVTKAHRVLCDRLSEKGLVHMPAKVDLAIVSAGGHPKDINLYQAQKALDNCANAVKENGVMILLAECGEGYGSASFEQWITQDKRPEDLLVDIQKDFVLGGHKAAAIAKVAASCRILLVTSPVLAQEKMVGLDIFTDMEEALQKAVEIVGEGCSYALFPLGASTLPKA